MRHINTTHTQTYIVSLQEIADKFFGPGRTAINGKDELTLTIEVQPEVVYMPPKVIHA